MARKSVVKKTTHKVKKKQAAGPVKGATSKSRKTGKAASAMTLHASMATGRASSAKAADGDEPVFAYIGRLPEPQRGIAERIDALAAKTLPGLKRSVKWALHGMASATAGAFVAEDL